MMTEKNCGNCEYCNLYKEVEPCNSCKQLSNWKLVHWETPEQTIKEQVHQIAEDNERECKTCTHKAETLLQEPCLSCDEDKLDKWESIEDKFMKAYKMTMLHNEELEMYKQKNDKYGDSFGISVKKYGLISALTRMSDKWNRIENLILNHDNGTDDESLIDSLKDLANYANMTIIEMEDKCK